MRPDGKALGDAFSALLAIKTRAGYSAQTVSAEQRKRAQRNAEKLLKATRARPLG